MEKEEQILKNRLQELAQKAFQRNVPTHSDFLNLNEQMIFQSISGTLPPVRYELTGGFLASERKVVCFLPSYEETVQELPFECLKIVPSNPRFAETLSHRDYLGAVMNLGIDRSMIGDIIIREQTAFLFVMKKISPYVREALTVIRRTAVAVSVCEETEAVVVPDYEEISGTVSSVRLDSIVALCARLSRSKAAAYIEAEKVSVNGRPVLSASENLKGGEILSIRGIGKFRFEEAGGQTKKGRTVVRILKYK